MLLPSDLEDLRVYVAQLAQRAIDRDDSGSASIRVEVCTAMAVAVHDVLSAVKMAHNDTIGVNKLPLEVLVGS
ncbi:hypothetical protein EXIGLDRAFT_832750 [Exidia glandulosa HHB12029]|uniref:Uncharacterized protein n=1 Tax=Exidia glandulosa HHB12029 TaxID=1314781 RepID=A0A165LB20_EXIGL|nr:hypothetical protein EXIGLDRAFT_832750 [Exidia glandulosa HHB12029]